MSKFMYYYESILVVMGRIEILRIDTEHTGKLILSDFPDMEIFDFTFFISFDFCFDLLYDRIIRSSIYEDSRGISHEKICPAKYEYRSEYSHSRVEPVPTIILGSEKCYDSKNRSECISNDMQICGLEIEIFVSCMVMVIIMMFMIIMSGVIVSLYAMRMILIVSKYESTDDIDQESYYGDDQCHIIVDHQRRDESLNRESSNKKSHNTQKNGAGIGSEYFYLPSTQSKLGILSMFTSKYICEK